MDPHHDHYSYILYFLNDYDNVKYYVPQRQTINLKLHSTGNEEFTSQNTHLYHIIIEFRS